MRKNNENSNRKTEFAEIIYGLSVLVLICLGIARFTMNDSARDLIDKSFLPVIGIFIILSANIESRRGISNRMSVWGSVRKQRDPESFAGWINFKYFIGVAIIIGGVIRLLRQS